MFEPDIPKSHAIAKFLAQRVFYEVFAWEPGLGLLHASCLNPAQRVFYEVFACPEPGTHKAVQFDKTRLCLNLAKPGSATAAWVPRAGNTQIRAI